MVTTRLVPSPICGASGGAVAKPGPRARSTSRSHLLLLHLCRQHQHARSGMLHLQLTAHCRSIPSHEDALQVVDDLWSGRARAGVSSSKGTAVHPAQRHSATAWLVSTCRAEPVPRAAGHETHSTGMKCKQHVAHTSLFMPLGPKEVLVMSDNFLAASMLRSTASSTPEKCLKPFFSRPLTPGRPV